MKYMESIFVNLLIAKQKFITQICESVKPSLKRKDAFGIQNLTGLHKSRIYIKYRMLVTVRLLLTAAKL